LRNLSKPLFSSNVGPIVCVRSTASHCWMIIYSQHIYAARVKSIIGVVKNQSKYLTLAHVTCMSVSSMWCKKQIRLLERSFLSICHTSSNGDIGNAVFIENKKFLWYL
jgi:hypothetical protein